VEEFEERYPAELGRYRDRSCVIYLGHVITPVVLVERETWEALFHTTTFDELGRDFRISNASKLVKVLGFPLDQFTIWMKPVAMATRAGKSEDSFWDCCK
jgi:hypothetical protein